MNRLKTIIITLLICTPLFVWVGTKKKVCRHSVITDTILIRDTIRDTVPAYKYKYIVRSDTVFLPSADTLPPKEVVIPIEEIRYHTDDYLAIVEGFKASLKYIEVYKKTQYITQTKYVTQKSRFSFGVQAGYGASKDGFSPFLGIGIQYNLFGW